MATNLTVDSADKSSRWYITPGISSSYDLQVHNDTDRAVLCRVTLASHPDTGSVKPQSLTLQAHETRTVAVTFGPKAELPRDRKAVITVKDAAGQVLKTMERELVSGSSTDATVELTWKSPIVENEKLCGFVLMCAIHSLSGAADEFTPEFGVHNALSFPKLAPVRLQPGQTVNLELPIRWNRAARDAEGWNHPRAIEASVAVSQGRRSGRLSWDVVARAIGDMLDRSDRSPVVERKAAAPAFTPSSSAPASGLAPASPDVAKTEVKIVRPLEIVAPVVPAVAAAAAVIVESAVPVQPAPQSQPKPHPNFEGYRPAFQLINSKATTPRNMHEAGLVGVDGLAGSPSDSAVHVDDLDSSIVGSGLNYARSANGAHVAVEPAWRRVPAGAWLAGIAAVAILGFVLTRPHGPAVQSAHNAATASAPAAVAARGPAVSAPTRAAQHIRVVARVAPKPKVAPSTAAIVQTPAATTAPAAQAQPVAAHVATVARTAPARTVARRPPPIDRSALPQIDFVDASYGRYGRAIRVQWNSEAQASADVQLTDARGTLIAERAVGGGRSTVLLGLPRGYHGDVYVQVSVTGYHSERVVQTTSLTPF